MCAKNLLPPANEVWDKVMFLHLSVRSHGGMMSLSVWLCGPTFHPGVGLPGDGFASRGVCFRRMVGQNIPLRGPEKWAVHILLECFLVMLLLLFLGLHRCDMRSLDEIDINGNNIVHLSLSHNNITQVKGLKPSSCLTASSLKSKVLNSSLCLTPTSLKSKV